MTARTPGHQQLLAGHLQPDHQRQLGRGHRQLPQQRIRLLGHFSGRAHPPGAGQRRPDPDGLLRQPGLRQRGLHRRLRVQRQRSAERFAAAVLRPRTPTSTAGPMRCGTRCSAETTALPPQSFAANSGDPGGPNSYTTLSTCGPTEQEPYLYEDSSGSLDVFVPSAGTGQTGPSWANGSTPGTSLSIEQLLRGLAVELGGDHRRGAGRRGQHPVHPGRLQPRRGPQCHHRRHQADRPGFLATLEPTTGTAAINVADVAGSTCPGSSSTPAGELPGPGAARAGGLVREPLLGPGDRGRPERAHRG